MPASESPIRPDPSRPSKAAPILNGKVFPEREADEAERRTRAYVAELNPSGEVGLFLCRLAATMSARIERCQMHETAVLADRVRQAIAEIDFPEGIDGAGIAKLATEASSRALFDASAEATLARKYAVETERTYFQALKELRLVEKQARAIEAELFGEELGSISPGAMPDETLGSSLPDEMTDEEFDELCARSTSKSAREPVKSTGSADFARLKGRVDVPIAIGKRR